VSAQDPAIASYEEAYQEGRTAIKEGEAILHKVAGSTGTNVSIMEDETAHKKQAAKCLFCQQLPRS
jgi:hypothetical protein